MNLEQSKGEYIGEFGGRKRKGKGCNILQSQKQNKQTVP